MTDTKRSAIDYLTCSDLASEEERAWYAAHAPVLADWIERELPDESVERDMIKYACHTLLFAPAVRAVGPSEWGREREPYCWDEVDAFELIHEALDHGVMAGWDYPLLLDYLRRAAMVLIEAGLIPEPEASSLVASFEVWIPRAIESRRTGRIHPPDGVAA